MEKTLHMRMKEFWNSMQNGETITAAVLREKSGGNPKEIMKISSFLSTLRRRGIAETKSTKRPLVYKKLRSIREKRSKAPMPKAERKEKKSFKETEFTSLEIGQGVMNFAKDIQDLAAQQKETISALKRKIDELTAVNKRVQEELEREKEKESVVKGETIRFSRPK